MEKKKSSSPWGALALLAAFAVAVAWFFLRPKATPAEPVAQQAETAEAPEPAKALPWRPLYPNQQPEAVAKINALALMDASPEEKFEIQMAQSRALLLEKTRYPRGSQPLALKTDLLLPHHVEPSTHGITSPGGRVLVTQAQDRVWVAPGQPGVVRITAKLDGAPVSVTFNSAQVVRHLDGQPDQVLGTVGFSDNGSAPDEIAGDGTYTGVVATPKDGTGASLTLTVGMEAGGERGTLIFQFVQTTAAPAVFTQTARDALENGSIAIYVGVQVMQAGVYEITGRLYDSGGAPIAYMRFYDQLTTDTTEVRLVGYGKLILDEGGIPPFVLRDVEGWEMLVGQYPDRALMADWPAGYTTAKYDLSQLTSADYDGPDKQARLQMLQQTEQNGLNDIRNGLPAPGVPNAAGPGVAPGAAPTAPTPAGTAEPTSKH
jgi:hypothetical protein